MSTKLWKGQQVKGSGKKEAAKMRPTRICKEAPSIKEKALGDRMAKERESKGCRRRWAAVVAYEAMNARILTRLALDSERGQPREGGRRKRGKVRAEAKKDAWSDAERGKEGGGERKKRGEEKEEERKGDGGWEM